MRHLLVAAMVAIAFGMAAAPVQADEVASATVSGACYADDDTTEDDADRNGASDSAGVTVTDDPGASVSEPDEDSTEEGLNACAEAAQNGEEPGAGSHATVSVTAGDETVEVSTTALP